MAQRALRNLTLPTSRVQVQTLLPCPADAPTALTSPLPTCSVSHPPGISSPFISLLLLFFQVSGNLSQYASQVVSDLLFHPTPTRNLLQTPQKLYSVYEDPAGWLSINPINGTVDTTAVLDRESPFVHNSVYTALFLAIDSGSPPATGTGTLLITLEDVNDNAPFIYPTVAEVCDDAKNLSVVILGASDKDLHPNTDPFKFEIHKQTVPDKVWKISKINNTHALVSLLQNLNKANYNLPIMVTDSGKPPMTNITDLRVQVCSCKNSKVDCNSAGALRFSVTSLLLLSLCSLAEELQPRKAIELHGQRELTQGLSVTMRISRIDDLEKNIADLMTQAGVEELEGENKIPATQKS
ncbi:Cadherin-13 [Tupaia chinensis]|uniref:Cadherin-13 n=1 Tax=Tupaia chinensis TaxID=246437 RepID=L9KP61_TUPCH|nr:Cadherin-13 [Tupaia chinensis]